MDWILIRKFGPEPIGAVGFLENQAVIVVSFFEDRDGNKDGKVGMGEKIAAALSPIKIDGMAVAEVAMQARVEPEVLMRDPGFAQMAANIFVRFARGLVLDGIYAAYFARGVGMAGGGLARQVTSGMVKQFAVKKGFEAAVKEAFKEAVGR
jgi:hypothetical protein